MPKPAQNPSLDASEPRRDAATTLFGPILTERQWLWLSARLPLATEKRGRPPGNNRAVVEGIFWIAATGQPWRELPVEYGRWSSVYRRFQRWHRGGVFAALLAHVRPFECGPQAPDAETSRLYERLAVIAPLAQRPRTRHWRREAGRPAPG